MALSIILNIGILFGFGYWFHVTINRQSLLLPVTGAFLGTSFVALILCLVIQNEYLDGILYLVLLCANILLIWIYSTLKSIVQYYQSEQKSPLLSQLIQLSPLILAPLVLWLLIRTATFKIGG